MRGYRVSAVIILALLACISTGTIVAQTSLAGVNGLVTDSSGAVVPGAEVSLRNVDTNQTRVVLSNDVGLYSFPSVPAGNYTLTAEMHGFSKFQTNLTLRVGQDATVNVRLTVGEAAFEVTVADSTPVVEASTSTLYDVKESDRIKSLPLNGRSIVTLFSLTPGVSREQNTTQVNGLQQGNVQFLADGVSIEDKYLGDFTRVSPAMEGIQEFRVEALNSSAQYSKPATISYLTRSGTNSIRGSAFETYRSNGLLARSPLSTKAQDKLIRHEFGGAVGGPVVLPKIYNGRDKTFFFFTYEGLRLTQRYGFLTGSPSEALRNGDFSNYIPQGEDTLFTIYDPLTSRLNPETGLYIRDPFPNNRIPADRISNLARKALSRYPMPNLPNAPLTQNLEVRLPTGTNEDKFTAKGDHQAGNDTFTVTFTFVDQVKLDAKGGATTEIMYNTATARTYQGTFANTHTFSPNLVNEFRLGFTRPTSRRGPASKDPKITDFLGLPNVTGDSGWPTMDPVDQYGDDEWGVFWDDDNPQTAPQLFTTWVDNLSLIKGRHSFKAGVQFRTMAVNSDERGQPRGNYEFGPEWTGLGDENGNLIWGTGSGFASFLLGYNTWGTLRSDKGFFYHRQNDLGVYFQDDWRVSPRLTLNLGLRYEYYTRYRDLRDQIATYDPASKALVLTGPVDQAFSVNPAAVKAYQATGVVFKTASEAGLQAP
ncbi:MAG: TonB-dependent receptor, partial [Acidobacteria bacterium]